MENMRDPELSPCIGVCELDPASGLCRGCLRSGNEIAIWPAASRELRRQILRRIAVRRDLSDTPRKATETAC